MNANKPLANAVAVVTGASRGVGRAVALRLASDGALVVVHYGSQQAKAREVVRAIEDAGGSALALQAELASVQSIDAFYEQLDAALRKRVDSTQIDVLVNNAGIAETRTLRETDEAIFDKLFQVNVKGMFFMTQRALPRLRDGARIVNISSVASRTHFPDITAYAATKGAVNTFSQHLAASLGHRGITVNTVSPGVIDTDMSAWVRSSEGAQTALGLQALQRVGKPEDVADVVAFFASKDARWITGAYVEASGGMRL